MLVLVINVGNIGSKYNINRIEIVFSNMVSDKNIISITKNTTLISYCEQYAVLMIFIRI